VLHVGPSNSRPGSGFTINWEGTSYDQLRTKHVSSFSSAESGVISYPGIGNYASSLAASWLISNEGNTDLQLSTLALESCSNPDPCTCDALLIYEINSSGNLKETTRFCSNITSPITTSALANSFVLTFFTDFIAAPNGASGFSVLYFPTDTFPEPTTPEWEWTTEESGTEEPETRPTTTEPCTTDTPTTEVTSYPTTEKYENGKVNLLFIISPFYTYRSLINIF